MCQLMWDSAPRANMGLGGGEEAGYRSYVLF
jgi:hypothetical protein